ncbi:hypothetical protein N7499_000259 [Penicillium canescens]|uniref:Uncharacterized protein n=1 Tax=Penicillium canescens TaxID=5083 RepID=A0AAD6IHM7_PENCN|nr:uncharacterized protein N7446_011541 [Penicillium canescens]KAJ6004189.1 hypothetical protein N7522_005834 [Penicillium canescens]KAJ6029114.1 hypothetical protein N7444_012101 [Penicillium canescens]KAJ6047546.1 hypothetical protein N7460_003693 [Penicillium canescens]KAJ6048858.1 hypothetical protein N7446_011541 [Penicillium canescens]KAJ6100629.1 hypothetical protein N7499_000259 [Penicillium canescens]
MSQKARNTAAELSAHADVRDVSSAVARACASALTSAATNRMYAFYSLTGSIPSTDHQNLIQALTLGNY